MEKEFIKFSKDFMYVIGDNGDRVDVSPLVAKAFNRHRYAIATKELQMQCVRPGLLLWRILIINL